MAVVCLYVLRLNYRGGPIGREVREKDTTLSASQPQSRSLHILYPITCNIPIKLVGNDVRPESLFPRVYTWQKGGLSILHFRIQWEQSTLVRVYE